MEALTTSAINVQVDTQDKEKATNILKMLGLNMSTYINMAIKQLIYTEEIPFRVKKPKNNAELLEALEESEVILKELKDGKRKGYDNMEDLIKSLEE